jgi:two-component system, sensor histidine kinase PdtaS
MSVAQGYAGLPTAAKLLLILTAVLLPIGIGLALIGERGIRQADAVLDARNKDQSRALTQAIESLVARNALALRIAANGALATGPAGACDRALRSLAIAPGVAQSFELETSDGQPICAIGEIGDTGTLPHIAPGDVRVRIAPDSIGVAVRVGVNRGMATAVVGHDELKKAIAGAGADIVSLVLQDDLRELRVLGPPPAGSKLRFTQWPISNGNLSARIGVERKQVTTLERLLLLLPLLMWIAAAMITWLLVSRLLVRPLKRLEHAVLAYRPADGALELPRKLGPSREIQELRNAFGRAISRVEESERETTGALEGQRRLVREVHHRVKNNLQVVASLLNIHGRSAETPDARAAYAGISRRVGALSIVHRNHFAEMEENRGLALRPLLTELGAELRATAPEAARRLALDLDLEAVNTTQDVAVAVAFLITEIVEFAILNAPEAPVEISLRRTSELTARLSLSSSVLVPDEDGSPEKVQFERIVGGLAKQLRSTLDRKLGRYSVDLPVFPST